MGDLESVLVWVMEISTRQVTLKFVGGGGEKGDDVGGVGALIGNMICNLGRARSILDH
jgi:hypothetical protein